MDCVRGSIRRKVQEARAWAIPHLRMNFSINCSHTITDESKGTIAAREHTLSFGSLFYWASLADDRFFVPGENSAIWIGSKELESGFVIFKYVNMGFLIRLDIKLILNLSTRKCVSSFVASFENNLLYSSYTFAT